MSESEQLDLKRLASEGAGPFTEEAREITISRRIPATPAEIFEAWRDPEIMRRWYFPGPDWSSRMVHDFETGGRYHLTMINTSGESFAHTGLYREVSPNHRIVFTWTTPFVKESLVTFTLHPQGDDTEVVIRHQFPAGVNIEMPGLHSQGWTGTLENIERLFT